MYFDLNIPVQKAAQKQNISKKGKQPQQEPTVSWTPAEISTIEGRIDLLVHLGYSVIGLSQTVNKKVDPKTHVNFLDSLLSRLRTRPGIVYLKRLNIILDAESEKGFGLINASVSLFNRYDLIALSAISAHSPYNFPSIDLPRLPYHLKHTLIRSAIKNGAVFEINYVGALGGENDAVLIDANAAESGSGAKRNWWSSTRELIAGGVVAEADVRPPRDISNLIHVLGLAQDAAHDAFAKTPKSLIIRAETRKTYRAVPPKVIIPHTSSSPRVTPDQPMDEDPEPSSVSTMADANKGVQGQLRVPSKRSQDNALGPSSTTPQPPGAGAVSGKKKKRKLNQEGL
ncbi:PHP domain-like protein [Gymnopilus junonius]|uniref:PHP domain-like protein n=1 Tax=Gymnopilus junonius TaxID=109634 RepID=A0A9P5TM90_GYMJU|nr:PHP domain-like protein [Gymnopilus junonius]